MTRGDVAVTPSLTIPAEELEWRVATAGGPGGQHANRAATRVVVTFRPGLSSTLTPAQRARVVEALGEVVRVGASRRRSQSLNRQAALEVLAQRLAEALTPVPTRRETRPTRASRTRRLEDKRARSRLKAGRGRPVED